MSKPRLRLIFCFVLLGMSLLTFRVPVGASTLVETDNEPILLASAVDFEQEMLGLFYGETELVTKTELSLKQVPGLVTVIENSMMRRRGARDLTDVLRMVPGLEVVLEFNAYPVVVMRGYRSNSSEKIIFMVNGHQVNSEWTGGATMFFADLAIEYIERVEVFRGAGSALYGANAMLGVINIVTRQGESVYLQGAVKGGSHGSQRYNLELAQTFPEVALWGHLNYHKSNGADVRVKRDILSGDSGNSTISLAPGHTSEWVERSDFYGGFTWHDLKLQMQYLDHNDGGFFNPSKALSGETEMERDYLWSEISWQGSFFDSRLELRPKISYDRHQLETKIGLRPPGFRDNQGRYFPDGKIGTQVGRLEAFTAALQVDWQIGADHLLTLGSEYRYTSLNNINYPANFTPAPFGEETDTNYNWIEPARRKLYSFFAQDQWTINSELYFVAGVRYDHYDDFGAEVSPRLSLVYQPFAFMRVKASYAESFSAPSFRALYKNVVGGVFQGNPNLDAEEGRCFELDCEFEIGSDLDLTMALYRNEFDHLIKEVPLPAKPSIKTFVNLDGLTTTGAELGLVYRLPQLLEGGDLRFNLAYAHTRDDSNNHLPGISEWISLVEGNIRFLPGTNLNLTCQYVGRSETAAACNTNNFDGYLLIDMTILVKELSLLPSGVGLFATVRNLLSEDYAYSCTSGGLPDGYTRPGTTFELGFYFEF